MPIHVIHALSVDDSAEQKLVVQTFSDVSTTRLKPSVHAGSKDTPLAAAQAPTYDATDFPEAWRPLLEGIRLQSPAQRAEGEAKRLSHARKVLETVAPALRWQPHSSAARRPAGISSLYSTFAAGPALEQQ